MEPLRPADPVRVGRFELVGRLGSGGMGRVFLGRTPEGNHAAVKVIREDLAGDTAFRARFRREVSAAVSVAGLFTARVLDADPEGDPPWLATQYIEGPTLRAAVERSGPLRSDRLGALALGLAEALGSIHAAGLVHRDLKPANVLLSPTGPRVIDFGIARDTAATRLTGTGDLIGTPDFMAPEQVEGSDAGAPADVFALGSTLAFAATGAGPFSADSAAATLYRILHGEPDLSQVPVAIRPVVAACLAKDPGGRPTVHQLAARLRTEPGPPAAQEPAPLWAAETLDPAGTRRPRPPAPRRRRTALAAVVGVVVLAGAGTAIALTHTGGVAGTAVAAPAPQVDPNDPKVRYVDRLCASGQVLTTLGDTAVGPTVSGDPAVARRDFLASTERAVGVVDAALADLVPLRDEAPTPQIGMQFGQMVSEFQKARQAFSDANGIVGDAPEPLTSAVYRAGIDRFTDGARNLALAATLQQGITLPKEYTAVADSAPHCTH